MRKIFTTIAMAVLMVTAATAITPLPDQGV